MLSKSDDISINRLNDCIDSTELECIDSTELECSIWRYSIIAASSVLRVESMIAGDIDTDFERSDDTNEFFDEFDSLLSLDFSISPR